MTPEPVTHPTLPPELRLFLEAIGFDPADEIDWDELDQAALQPIIRWRLAAQALNLNQHTAPSIGHLRQLATFPGFAENTLGPFFDLSSGPHPTEVALAEVMVKGVAERLTQHTAAMGRLATVIAESSKVLREALLPTHPELAEQEEADKAAGKSRLLRLATLAAQSIGSPTQIRDEDLCMLLQGAMPVGRRLHVAPATRAWTWTHEEHVSADFTSPGSAIRSAWRHLLGVLSGEGEWSLTSEQVGHALWLCGYHPGDEAVLTFEQDHKQRHGVTVIHSPGFLLQRAQEVLRLIRLEVGNTEDTWNATLARVRQLATLVSNLAALQASADCPTAADISVDLAQLDIEAAGKRMVEDMRSLANYRGRACTKWPMCVELSREGGSAADAPTSSAEIVALRDALLTRGFASSDIDQMDVAKMRSELARCP